MMRLYIWLALAITIQIISSRPLSVNKFFKRNGNRRDFMWNMNDIRSSKLSIYGIK